MKIYGFFRGFPGLGRVMSGIGLLSMLKDMGHQVKAYSYLQGVQPLKDHKIDVLLEKQPPMHQIMAIGLNPICEVSGELIETICTDNPDLVIIDGEPLFISTLAMVFPKDKILSLLNPADLYNTSLPVSTLKFYHFHYLSAGSAVVHGVDKGNIVLPEILHGCDVFKANTILRRDVIDTVRSGKTEVVAVLGGGSSNASDNFWNSTVRMGKRVIDVAAILREKKFVIYCNDTKIAEALMAYRNEGNVDIVSEFALPQNIYSNAEIILCRAGRNTISEILYLNIPAILMSSNGDFRSSEQEKNIDQACELRPGKILKFADEETVEILAEKIFRAIHAEDNGFDFIPGNMEAIDFVLNKAKT